MRLRIMPTQPKPKWMLLSLSSAFHGILHHQRANGIGLVFLPILHNNTIVFICALGSFVSKHIEPVTIPSPFNKRRRRLRSFKIQEDSVPSRIRSFVPSLDRVDKRIESERKLLGSVGNWHLAFVNGCVCVCASESLSSLELLHFFLYKAVIRMM